MRNEISNTPKVVKSASRSPLKADILMDITEHVDAENEITKL